MSTSFALPETQEQTTALVDAVVAGFAEVPAQDGWTAEPLDRSDVAAVEGQAVVVDVGGSHCFAVIARKSLVAAIDLEYPDRGLLGVLGPALESIVRALGGEVSAADATRATASDVRARLGDGDIAAVSVFDDGSLRATVVVGRIGSDGLSASVSVPRAPAMHAEAAASASAIASSVASTEEPVEPEMQSVSFAPIELGAQPAAGAPAPVGILSDVQLGVSVELGRARMSVREILRLTLGSVIELDRPAGAPVDLFVNGTLIARGEVVVIDEEFGVRVSEVIGYRADGLGR